MKDGKRGDMYNIGGNNELENIRVVEIICDILDSIKKQKSNKSRRELITFVKDRPGHDRRYAIDSTKLKNELGWAPEERFETGINKTIQWYLNNQEWVKRVKRSDYHSWLRKHYGL
jgi:dTDP-glucose 4,6-dehydratase